MTQHDKDFILVAGPCSAESEQQVMTAATQLASQTPVSIFRAGVWKPRSRPGSFEGMGSPALQWVIAAGKATGLKTAVEVGSPKHVEEALQAGVDFVWIGARTTVNPFYVQEIAQALENTGLGVMVKNPVNPDLALWLGSIERIEKQTATKPIVVHRGFSGISSSSYRNHAEWQIPIELMRIRPDLQILCDPSHIGGSRTFLKEISQKALDLGMNGLMIESHPEPDAALSDSKQQLTPAALCTMLGELTFRSTSSKDLFFNNKLQSLRGIIDELDQNLIELLSRRLKIIEEIGVYKRENNITILQLERWNQILTNARTIADDLKLDKEFIVAVFNQIHLESIKLQTEILNATAEPNPTS